MEPTPDLLALLIEDEITDAMLVRRMLGEIRDGRSRLLECAATLGEGLDRLGKGDVDVVLLDLNLPDSNGNETVRRLRREAPEIPMVVFTSLGDEDTALAALQAGAQDYLAKDELSASLLLRSMGYAIERVRIQRGNRELQARLDQALRLESLTALSLGLSWALKCEVGTIDEAVDEILAENQDEERLADPMERLVQIRRSTHMLAELTRGLTYFAGGSRPRPSRVDLSGLVAGFSDFLEAVVRDRAELNFDLPRDLPGVRVDAAQLRHAVANLVVNAVEAGDAEPGGVFVRTGVRTVGQRYLAEACVGADLIDGSYVFLAVSDRGRAIERSSMTRLFEPCFTHKMAGRGLGLAAVLGVVRAHGGAIKVESEPGGWTTFTILLPPAPETP